MHVYYMQNNDKWLELLQVGYIIIFITIYNVNYIITYVCSYTVLTTHSLLLFMHTCFGYIMIMLVPFVYNVKYDPC